MNNRNSRYNGRPRRKRRSAFYRYRYLILLAALVVIAAVVLVIVLSSGEKEDPNAPSIQPVVVAEEPTLEPTPDPTLEPTVEPAAEIPVVSEEVTDAEIPAEEAVENPFAPEATPSSEEAAAAFAAAQALTAEASAEPLSAAKNTSGTGLRSVHMRMVGDIMFHDEQLAMAKQADGTYDFSLQLKYIADSLGAADYTMANLETTVGKYKKMDYSGYPMFNTPESILPLLKEYGVDFFTMANNHMLDRYFDGLKNDVNLVEQYGFDHVGAYRTQEERNTPVVVNINGINFGFVAYTHTTNTVENACDPDAVKYGVPYLYKSDIEADIQRVKDAGAEVVVAFPHWGEENTYIPDDTQKQYAIRLAKAGANIILGSHSHMVEPMDTYYYTDEQGVERQIFYIYSMGNFISGMTLGRTDNGIILDFTVREKADGTFYVDDIGYVPVYVWKQNDQLTVIPIGKYKDNRPSIMNDTQYNRMMESYRELTGVLGTEKWSVLSE